MASPSGFLSHECRPFGLDQNWRQPVDLLRQGAARVAVEAFDVDPLTHALGESALRFLAEVDASARPFFASRCSGHASAHSIMRKGLHQEQADAV